MARRYKPFKPTALCASCGRRWTITSTGLLRRHATFAGCKDQTPVDGTELPSAR
jgi:hypothetical protein